MSATSHLYNLPSCNLINFLHQLLFFVKFLYENSAQYRMSAGYMILTNFVLTNSTQQNTHTQPAEIFSAFCENEGSLSIHKIPPVYCILNHLLPVYRRIHTRAQPTIDVNVTSMSGLKSFTLTTS